MARFLSKLVVEKLEGPGKRNLWRLTRPLRYDSDLIHQEVVVPRKFLTDFASVPRLPLTYLLAGDTAHEAAVIHDYLYQTNGVSRRIADAVFYEAMRVTGEPRWRAWMLWLGVRAGGWFPWKKYRAHGTGVHRIYPLFPPPPPPEAP